MKRLKTPSATNFFFLWCCRNTTPHHHLAQGDLANRHGDDLVLAIRHVSERGSNPTSRHHVASKDLDSSLEPGVRDRHHQLDEAVMFTGSDQNRDGAFFFVDPSEKTH